MSYLKTDLEKEYDTFWNTINIELLQKAINDKRTNFDGSLRVDLGILEFNCHLWADGKIKDLDLIYLREQISESQYEESLRFLEGI